jgi:hypothetical protein
MRKMMLLAAVVAIAALMLAAAPAMAEDNNHDGFDDATSRFVDDDDFCDIFDCDEEDFCDIFDCDEEDFCDFFDCDRDGFFFDGDGINQDFEQEAESGDVDQSFDVSQTGDNSNQTAGIQGVANTGNAQNQIGVIDAGDFNGNDFNNGNDFCEDFDGNDFCEDLEEFCDDFDGNGICDFFFDDGRDRFDDGFFFGDDDGGFEFDNVGSTIEVSPINTTSSNQQVNQAASASGS